MTKQQYPGVMLRVKALVIDSVLLVLIMILVSFLFSKMETVPESFRIAAFVLIFFLYDPLFTSILGGTIGHKAHGIRVKQTKNHNRNIFFPLSLIRFLLKSLFGIISLITLSFNDERKGIHDFASGSIVLYDTIPSNQNSNEQEG